ncbi:hypothetical protein [Acidovorax sp. LjRoot194]|uniref:hypothetical protein n=1 Tax=Acidovorax sp. LjRoot194 TaxID=3342280 RepID=UPI003ECE5497
MTGNPFLSCHGCSSFAGWFRSRSAMQPGCWLVAEWGQWGTPQWLTAARNYCAVVDDFGALVRVGP